MLRYYTDMAEDEYLTAGQAAEKLQLHPRTVRRLLVDGELPGKKIGAKEWRISAAALKSYIEGGQKPSTLTPKAQEFKKKPAKGKR
jgi:excisionase family DNA binding protein